MSTVTFSALATAAYCPRKLYYRRRSGGWDPPPAVQAVRALAYRYDRLLRASDAELAAAPVAVEPEIWRRNLRRSRERLDGWQSLCDPVDRDRYLAGKDCRGIAQKVLSEPAGVSLLSTGDPPSNGVYKPHRVKAVAAAKALAWERQAPVDHAYLEYPAHGIVRRVPLDGRRRAEYRRVLRTVRTMTERPPRLENRAKCRPCEYRSTCGVGSSVLRSPLG